MKKIYPLLLLFVVFTQLRAYSSDKSAKKDIENGILSGTVTDAKTALPLGGATIYIHDLKTGAIANNDGRFATPLLKNGKYTIEVSYSGYKTLVETVEVTGNTTHDFALQQSVVEQEAVIVTGVTSAISSRRSPQPVTVVKRTDLLNVSSTNVIDALTKTVPGVNAVTTGPAISKPFIRGLGYNRVVTISDGLRLEGQQWGDEHGIEIDDYSVKRIEVLKGPASLIYGSDALAGVINIQQFAPVAEGTTNANIISEYQTNNKLRAFYGDVASTHNGFTWGLNGSYKAAADYKNKYDGRVFNSKFKNFDVAGMMGYNGSWGHSNLIVSSFDQHLGIVEGARDSVTGAFLKQNANGTESVATTADFNSSDPMVPYQRIRHFKIGLENTFNFEKTRLDITAGYQRNRRQEFGDAANSDDPTAFFDLKTFNYDAIYHLPVKLYWKTSIGLSGMAQSNTNRTDEAIIPNYDLFDIGGFVFTQYSNPKTTISGGIRFDNRHVNSHQMMEGTDVKFTAFQKDFSNVSGSAGISYQASQNVTLKANLARGFRAPNLAELGSNGAHEGTNRYEVGNRNLKSETSTQFDAGVEIISEHVSFLATAYYNHISNFLFYQNVLNKAGADSILVDPATGDAFNVFRFAQHTANLYGIEANFDIHPHPLDWLHFQNIFSYTHAQFTGPIGGSENLPLIPAARYIGELKGNFLPRGNGMRNLYFSLQSDYTFAQTRPFTGYNTETATPSYWVMNAAVGTDITSKGKTIFSIHIAGNNLTDVAYQNHLSRLKYTDVNNRTGRQGVFNMGRNISFKVHVPMVFHKR
ncbi:MAG: TonB-dependent receptor [Chitinophagaceae bacterium]|nr:TonB-dependent receptor [Chitinophagaceae bacterium]